MVRGISRAFFRPLAFFTKEFVQIWRQPRLILTLIVGPFAVLLLFGLGYNAQVEPITTVLVIPADLGLPTTVDAYKGQFAPPFELVGVTENESQAVAQLKAQQVGAVLVIPSGAYRTIASGHQATTLLLFNELDPLQRTWLEYYGYVQTSQLNRQLLVQVLQRSHLQPSAAAAATSQSGVGAAAVAAAVNHIPPQVLVSPFRPTSKNLAPTNPGFVAFYAPGVLALLVEHISVTLTALSLVRERLSGSLELFGIAPVSPREILAGKYVSYFLQAAVMTAILAAVLIAGLGVPSLGSWGMLVLTLALLIAASLGLGFFISAVSRTETQAVQLSLLVLLAAVFFSGFFLPLQNLLKPVWVVSYALPVTYGIRALQNEMLRGQVPQAWVLAALGGIALVLVASATTIFQAQFRRR
ncbi:MAG TPA: ABC transporter permease [Thermomicrobiaceae bacterium]|nr:ABC transporter permease [Thermomicrobiaceae bacterium]